MKISFFPQLSSTTQIDSLLYVSIVVKALKSAKIFDLLLEPHGSPIHTTRRFLEIFAINKPPPMWNSELAYDFVELNKANNLQAKLANNNYATKIYKQARDK